MLRHARIRAGKGEEQQRDERGKEDGGPATASVLLRQRLEGGQEVVEAVVVGLCRCCIALAVLLLHESASGLDDRRFGYQKGGRGGGRRGD